MKNIGLGLMAAIIGLLGVSNANAALTAPTFATTDIDTIAAAVLGFLAVVWAVKIAIGFVRSR